MSPVYPIEIHTHRLPVYPGTAIVSLSPSGFHPLSGHWYSVGLHPWDTLHPDSAAEELALIPALLSHPQLLAVGEVGYDTLRGGELSLQQSCFEQQAAWAEEFRKPVVIHAVKAAELLWSSYRRLSPQMPWIIHGFRGKPQAAEQYCRHGLYLSYGHRFNPLAVRSTPLDRLLLESDESEEDIHTLYAEVARLKGETVESLHRIIGENVQKLFFPA